MPKREDEFWAGMKELRGQGLCPFCGSSNVYYNKRFQSWRCSKCEKSFPSPSYGPGGDFGKEARWFGKTTEGIRRREFAEVAREARAVRRKKSGGSGFSLKKTFLVLLAIALIGATVSAFAGVQPMASYKDNAISFVEQSWENILEAIGVGSDAVVTEGDGSGSTSSDSEVEIIATENEVANLFYTLVNEKRMENGLPPLKKSSLLEELAIEHSENMARTGHFGHERLGWRDLSFGMSPGTMRGENISLTPVQRYIPGPFLSSGEVVAWAVDGLLSSPGHRANMLSNTFAHTGVGVVMNNGYFYITQIFEG